MNLLTLTRYRMKINRGPFSMVNCFVCLMVVNADIPRYDDNYKAKFHDVHKGRLFPIMKAFGKQMSLEECAKACISFVNCESVNHNDKLKLCELCSDVYDEYEAIENPSDSWYNYATPPKQDGGFTQWSKWSDCPQLKECEEVTHTRYRTCTNPSPDFGGTDCLGDRLETKKCQRNFPCSSRQNNVDICYSKENPKGFFEAKYTGVIEKVVFYHKNGSIRCDNSPNSIYSYWGCVNVGEDCAKNNCFSIRLLEKDSDEKLVPHGLAENSYGSYNLPNHHKGDAQKITLGVKHGGVQVSRGKEYYVTIGLYDVTALNKLTGFGTHCIDVEFIYTSI